MHKFLFYNKFIICLYTFRALLCSSSGGQHCIIQHLVSSHSVGGRPVHRLRGDWVYFMSSTCFEHYVLIIRRSTLYYTASGIITLCRWPSGAQVERGLSILYVLYMFRALCAHHQEVKIVLYSIRYRHTCRWPSGAPDGHLRPLPFFEASLLLMSQASMPHNKAAFEVTLWSHHLVSVVTRLPKCSMIIPDILLYLCRLYINVSFVIRYYIFQ